jgi:hypothetical protein
VIDNDYYIPKPGSQLDAMIRDFIALRVEGARKRQEFARANNAIGVYGSEHSVIGLVFDEAPSGPFTRHASDPEKVYRFNTRTKAGRQLREAFQRPEMNIPSALEFSLRVTSFGRRQDGKDIFGGIPQGIQGTGIHIRFITYRIIAGTHILIVPRDGTGSSIWVPLDAEADPIPASEFFARVEREEKEAKSKEEA